MVEHHTENVGVPSSILGLGTIKIRDESGTQTGAVFIGHFDVPGLTVAHKFTPPVIPAAES